MPQLRRLGRPIATLSVLFRKFAPERAGGGKKAATGVTDSPRSGIFSRSRWLESGMSFKSLRERRLLSQERAAELSGLSLRTIQRAEAGHRVSYASLRALAATFEMDVDLLERELYAMNPSTDDFVEIPRWVRLWTNAWWSSGPRPSRRQAHIAEAICMGCGIVFLVASLLVPHLLATVFGVGAGFMLVCGYLLSVSIRIVDTYKLWPGTEISWREWRPARTLRGTVIDYTFVFVVLIVFFGLVFWL